MREIPAKNYVVLVFVIVATLFLVFFTRMRYLETKEYEGKINERIDTISEVKEDEINNYLMENREVVIYIASSTDESIIDFENALNTYVSEEQLSKEIIYINLNNISEKFLKRFKNKYFDISLKNTDTSILKQPNMLIVDNGKVTSLLYSEQSDITLDDVKKFLNKYVDEVL